MVRKTSYEKQPATKGDVAAVTEQVTSHIVKVEQRLDARIDKMERRLDTRIDKLDAKIDGVEQRLGEKISHLDTRLARVEDDVHTIATTVAKIDRRLEKQQHLEQDVRKLQQAVFGHKSR